MTVCCRYRGGTVTVCCRYRGRTVTMCCRYRGGTVTMYSRYRDGAVITCCRYRGGTETVCCRYGGRTVTLCYRYGGGTVIGRLHMTIGLQTGMQTRCPYRFANRSSCVNGQTHCFQTGRLSDRKNQTCLILAIRQTTRAMCKTLLRSV